MPWASRRMHRSCVWGVYLHLTELWATIPRLIGRLTNRPPRRVEGRADLPEQLLAGVGLRNKPAKTLRQHGADLVLLGKSAAQHDVNAWVDRLQFLEYSVPIHHWQKEIQYDQANLT